MSRQIQQLAPDEVYGFLHSRREGLQQQEVEERLHQLGANILEQPRRWWWAPMLGRQFINFFSLLLDLSAAICFVADHIQPGEQMDVLGGALLGVSVLNSLFSFVQEYRAEKAMEELGKLLPKRVLVQRGGDSREVDAESIVPGDILIMHAGDRVPADARVVSCDKLLVNNASLSGESRPLAISAEACDCELMESGNVLFAGCTVLQGVATAVVYATGFRTEFGKIALLSSKLERKVSPLERETAHMVRILTVIAVSMGLGFFAYGVYTERSLWINLVFMMGIIVANVPEGLLPTFTLSLALAGKRMARKRVLIKGLNAVETMGAVHVICTDKTGTLTENRLSISRLIDGIDGQPCTEREQRRRLIVAAAAASQVESGRSGFTGDPFDVCIAELFTAEIGDAGGFEGGRRHFFPFEQQRLHSAGIVDDDGGTLFAAKGAWESLRPLISHIDDGDGRPLAADDAALERADGLVSRLGGEGFRLLAVARRSLAGDEAEMELDALEQRLTLAGFLLFEDPLRAEVPEAVARCHTAGIRVIMVTGDHPDTAESIARRAGIVGDGNRMRTITGSELAGMRESELVRHLQDGCAVFARTTPEQKMKIVSALHELEMVVAVTGDGVNDAPALKSADVGIAMGLSGTDVARESAQVILLDDNFASIVAGIGEGRTIFANIRKFTNYVLVSNGPEILPYLIYIIFPVPLALTVIQILLIDLGTDIIPSMALGQEPSDADVMEQPPRGHDNALLTWPLISHSYLFLGLIEAGFALSLFFWVLSDGGWHYGMDLPATDPLYRSATGITLASIMLMQIGNLIGRRSATGSGLDAGLLRNRLILLGFGMEALFSWAVLYFPPVSNITGTGPVDTAVYAVAWCGIPLIFGLDYLRKRIARRWLPLGATPAASA